MKSARRVLLPMLQLTSVVDENSPVREEVTIPATLMHASRIYHVALKTACLDDHYAGAFSREVFPVLKLFPLVLSRDGAPWAEANMWLLNKALDFHRRAMSSVAGNADDLAAYLRFLEEADIDWAAFPANKLQRPTYKYYSYLKYSLANAEIAHSTARRRMATVIRFYRWLQYAHYLQLAHEPWKETERIVFFNDSRGFRTKTTVITTDISFKQQKVDDPYDGFIDDGGKLRALSQSEQRWLLEALLAAGNTEMTLIHLLGLLTGARIQSILTMKVRHVMISPKIFSGDVLRLAIGPGTGIDTKNNKKMVLHIPVWFFRLLQNYAVSHRARKRRMRAAGGDIDEQYLFLSVRGNPFYDSKSTISGIRENEYRHHDKTGQAVRQFIKEKIIPYIRLHHGDHVFQFRFHDTRATFGMNLMDSQLALVERGETTLKNALEFVKTRLSHESVVTTERYLNYRSRIKMIQAAQNGWENEIYRIVSGGIKDDN